MNGLIDCDGCAVFQSPFMMKTMGKSDHEHPLLHAPFLVLHQMESSVSVVFDFNASLSDVAPVSPIVLSVDYVIKSGELVDTICVVCFVFTLQIEFCECCV